MPATITDEAIAAVGEEDASTDWQLRPLDHAAALSPEAGALKRILERPGIKSLMSGYIDHDRRAVAAQRRYKRLNLIAIWARLGAIAAGALFLLPVLARAEPGALVYRIAIGAQYSCLLLAFLFTAVNNYAGLYSRWMGSRAKAELARRSLFNFVLEADEPAGGGELPPLPLQLEYFRKYQLDVQCRFYHGRGAQHAKAAGLSRFALKLFYLLSGLAAVPVLFVLLGFFGIELSFADELGKGFLVFGVIASGLFASVLAISQMHADERNAARYAVAEENLQYLREHELTPARDAAAAGDKPAVSLFVNAAHRLISAEHQEWTLLRETVPRPEKTAQFIMQPANLGGR
jgi:hypothetical protein